MKCFSCQQEGHMSQDCQWEAEISETAAYPGWCGTCDPRTRMLTLAGGDAMTRCPACCPKHGSSAQCPPGCPRHGEQLLAQHARCHRCRKIVYAWEAGLPCAHHRVVTEWQDYYHSPQFVTDCREIREIAARGKSERPDRREEAARQVAEFRASPAYPGNMPAHMHEPIAPRIPED
jgi:hypothetical protein